MSEEVRKANLSDIKFDKSNANKGSVRGRGMLEASMREFGFADAGTLDRHNTIIGGNKRTEVAGEISLNDEAIIIDVDGTKPVYIRRNDLDLSDPDDDRARKLAYALNRTSEVSLTWDAEQLLADIGAGLDLSSMFHEDELDDLLAGLQPEPEPVNDSGGQVDKAEELRVKWQVETGQLWQLDQHRLVCGDCTDAAVVARVMQGEKADCVVTDPPYGMYLDTDFSGMKSKMFKGKTGGAYDAPVLGDHQDYDPSPLFDLWDAPEMFLWGADYYAERLRGKNSGSWLVWDKRLDDSADKMYGSCFELCWSKVTHKRDIIRVKWAGIFGMEKEDTSKRVHPTQKPSGVLTWIYERYTEPGSIVTDPYVGSGTTIIACEQLGRKCRAVEISPAYVAVALQRWSDATSKTPVLVE